MLERIKIENYRCFIEHEIEFKELAIIVGKNNAGKSTLIEALRVISFALGRFRTAKYVTHPKWLDLPKIARGISPSLESLSFNTENVFHQYGEPPSIITAFFSNENRVIVYIGPNTELFCTLKNNRDEYISYKGAAIDLNVTQMNILPQISPLPKKETVLASRDYVRRHLSSDLASLHFRNQLILLYENFLKFAQLAESSWKGLRIRQFDGRNGIPGEPLSLLIQDGGFVSEVSWMGSGLQMWLQIMWFLSRVNENEIIILNELPKVFRNLF